MRKPTVVKQVSEQEWINQIKASSYVNKIKEARLWEKKDPNYEKIKRKLPCICWNFNFKGYKENGNITSSTGLMYFDLDYSALSGLTYASYSGLTQNDKVYLSYQSFGGKGYGLVVKVSGVTAGNFSSTYDDIAQQLGIDCKMDQNSRKMTQYSVLSYDPDLYYNEKSYIFSATPVNSLCEVKKVSSLPNLAEREHIPANDTFFRYSNIDDYADPNDIVVNKVGVDVVKLFLPERIYEGKRKHTLLAYCTNLVLINPEKSYDQVVAHLIYQNNKRCEVPLEEREIHDVVKSIFKYKKKNSLAAQRTIKRKIIIGKNLRMTPEEKRAEVNKIIGKWKSDATRERIGEAIQSWSNEEKITAKSIAALIGMSLITVKRYWEAFKDEAKKRNKEIQGSRNA